MVANSWLRVFAMIVVVALVGTAAPGEAVAGGEWEEIQQLKGREDADTWFGVSVGVAGDTALIGAPSPSNVSALSGEAYFYEFEDGQWVVAQVIGASDASPADAFGSDVALSRRVAAVEARWADGGSGAVYIFRRHGDEWVEEASLTASDLGDGTATSIGSPEMAGNRVVVSASNGVYVFGFDGDSWSEEAKLPVLGRVVAHRNRIAVRTGSDEIQIYVRLDGHWTLEAILAPPPGGAFGLGPTYRDIAFNGRTLAAFDGSDQDYVNPRPGAVHLFRRTQRGWVLDDTVTAPEDAYPDPSAAFGSNLAIDGSTLVVGRVDVEYGDNGIVYVYQRRTDRWLEEASLAPDLCYSCWFSNPLALSASHLLVGAFGSYSGSAKVFGYERTRTR